MYFVLNAYIFRVSLDIYFEPFPWRVFNSRTINLIIRSTIGYNFAKAPSVFSSWDRCMDVKTILIEFITAA